MINDYLKLLWNSFKVNAHKPALTDKGGTRTITYHELEKMVDKIASSLKALKGEDISPVPILMDNEAEYLISELAVWKAGLSFIPLAISYPKERIDFIKNQNDVKIILDKELFDKLSNEDFKGFDKNEEIPMQSKAFLIYTSGSTGSPKGILHTFDSLMYLHRNNSPFSGIENIVWGSSAPFYFIASTWANFEILISGGLVQPARYMLKSH